MTSDNLQELEAALLRLQIGYQERGESSKSTDRLDAALLGAARIVAAFRTQAAALTAAHALIQKIAGDNCEDAIYEAETWLLIHGRSSDSTKA